ncbi:ribosomal protein L6 [Raphidocelis subcapitata]|uniref:Ribosomal protein L6 n=1 Tax=Raphidocelis subcapitata TaxID=307507 RepID=A0A2V0PH48_9CHLO|nr:ribosomal protein L6 [Raphidocelis subcapitata]|eukprot:GBF98899.1 ribosomal protein L6 [Raphidocelis subcapitata]
MLASAAARGRGALQLQQQAAWLAAAAAAGQEPAHAAGCSSWAAAADGSDAAAPRGLDRAAATAACSSSGSSSSGSRSESGSSGSDGSGGSCGGSLLPAVPWRAGPRRWWDAAGPAGGASCGFGGLSVWSGSGSAPGSRAAALHTSTRLPGRPAGAAAPATAPPAAAAAPGGARRGIVLAPADAAPRPLPRFRRLRGADDTSKWKRMVVRIPPQVQVEMDEEANTLALAGMSGSARVNLSQMDPTGLVAMQLYGGSGAGGGGGGGALLLCVSPSKRHFRSIQSHIDNAVHGVMQGYLVGVTVKGVGYRLEPADGSDAIKRPPGAPPSGRRLFWEPGGDKVNVAYPHKEPSRVVRLKVGYTQSALYKLPEGVVAFFIKPTLVYLYGVDKALVTGTAAALRAVRPPNPYTGNGVLMLGEEVKLRQRAGSK